MYSSTCFGRPHAHHQELNCSSSLWYYRWSVVVTALLPPGSSGNTRGCYCSCWASDDGLEDARNMLSSWWWAWGCPKHVELYINVKKWTWEIVASSRLIYLNCVMTHGLANFKFNFKCFETSCFCKIEKKKNDFFCSSNVTLNISYQLSLFCCCWK